jgi:hypothetical protein
MYGLWLPPRTTASEAILKPVTIVDNRRTSVDATARRDRHGWHHEAGPDL